MPVLPIMDLLIFLGWTTLAAGGVLKAIYIATSYRPTIFSLTPIDLILVACALLALALTLAARTWVRLNEPRLTAGRRADLSRDAIERASAQDQVGAAQPKRAPAMDSPEFANQWQRVR